MSFDKVDPKVDFPAQERDVLAFGTGRRLSKSSARSTRTSRSGRSWTDRLPPTTQWASTTRGVGPTRTSTNGTTPASVRKLRYQNGFDCQGLWVEVEVEKEHRFKCKKDIESFGIGKFVEECKARATKFAAIQTEQSIRLGYWMDWSDSYYTMSDENNYGIWAFLKKCYEKGLVYKGIDVMPWCPRCGTGISQMEMNEGYREVPHTSVFITMPLREATGREPARVDHHPVDAQFQRRRRRRTGDEVPEDPTGRPILLHRQNELRERPYPSCSGTRPQEAQTAGVNQGTVREER